MRKKAGYIFIFLLFITSCLRSGEKLDIKSHKDIFARGVYWPFERTWWVAKNLGMDFWVFVENKVKELKEDFNCNVIWVVNISVDEAAKLCDIAERYGILVLPTTMPLVSLYNQGISDEKDIEKAAEESFKLLGSKKSLGGYVLVDEPTKIVNKQMEIFRKALKKFDKVRDSIVVTMNQDTQSYICQTGFPVVCADIYAFGAERSPNIPNNPDGSRWYYRSVFVSYCKDAKIYNKKVWAMPQAFAENWGPWWYDENMNVVVGKGTYMHWRMPSVSEIRWQIWEALRTGCKGIVFFVYLPCPNNWTGTGDMPSEPPMKWMGEEARRNNWPITENIVKTNMPEALLYKNGSPTPHMKEIGRLYRFIAQYEDLLFSLKQAEFPVAFVESPFKVNTFSPENEDENVRYVVLVNDFPDIKKTATLYLLPNVKKVYDMFNQKQLDVSMDSRVNFLRTEIPLEPGDGTLLKVEFEKCPGFLVFEEDFSMPTTSVSVSNIKREFVGRPFSTGWDWVFKKKDTSSQDKGVIKIEGISRKRASSTGGFGASEKFMVYMFVEGNYLTSGSMVIEFIDKEGNKEIGMRYNYHLPCLIPYGTKDVNIYIEDSNVEIDRIIIWAIGKN